MSGAARARIAEMLWDLRQGALPEDAEFDRVFPAEVRRHSALHWTPVAVAARAARLLVSGRPSARIADIGSGAGKFCLIGAARTGAEFVGIEQRAYLVSLACELAGRYAVPGARFLNANALEVDWKGFDGLYLFNPFHENLPQAPAMDRTVRTARALHDTYVNATRAKLSEMPVGTRVATYWGFGGELPDSYSRVLSEDRGRGALELWVKHR